MNNPIYSEKTLKTCLFEVIWYSELLCTARWRQQKNLANMLTGINQPQYLKASFLSVHDVRDKSMEASSFPGRYEDLVKGRKTVND